MTRAAIALLALVAAGPAEAGVIAVVDFDRAIVEVKQDEVARDRSRLVHAERMAEVERMRRSFEEYLDYWWAFNGDLLDPEGDPELQAEHRALQEASSALADALQETFASYVHFVRGQMRALVPPLAQERGYDLVLVGGMPVPYAAGEVVDMTPELVTRYVATHGLPEPSSAPEPE